MVTEKASTVKHGMSNNTVKAVAKHHLPVKFHTQERGFQQAIPQ